MALCIAAFPRASGESLAQRARVLAPVLAQNADIAAWRRRRPNAVDVDPDSGEVRVDADADTDAEALAAALSSAPPSPRPHHRRAPP